MTLEQEAARQRGGFGVRPASYGTKRPTGFDAFLRAVAFLLLLAFLSAALLVLWTFLPVGFLVTVGASWIFLAFLASRARELRVRVQSLEAKVEALKSKRDEEPEAPVGGS